MPLSANEVNQLKRAPEVVGVLPVFLERWSPRSFSEREVSAADLKRVFEAARWMASSGNAQPWLYLLGLRGSETHHKIASTLKALNPAWAPKAPVLILGTARTMNDRGATNAYAVYDLGAATACMVLQATVLGLATHQMGGFDHDAARRVLRIPEEYALGSVMALGYQDEPDALANEELIKREAAPRERKPLSQMVFSAWGEPADIG